MSRTINIWTVKHYSNEGSAYECKQSPHLSNALLLSPGNDWAFGRREREKPRSLTLLSLISWQVGIDQPVLGAIARSTHKAIFV